MAKKKKKEGFLRKLAYAALAIGLVAFALVGWNWLNNLVCEDIVVTGNRHAAAEDIMAIARVDTGGRLFGIEPGLIEDRVRRHPWVRSAEVVRMPPSTLSIRVEEREPMLLAVGSDGVPDTYLDAAGFMMPVGGDDVYDVPLLQRARLTPKASQPVPNRALLELVAMLDDLSPSVQTLISSIEVEPSGELSMRTIPAGGRGSIYVRLGRRDFADKFARLEAFWNQALLSRPEVRFDLIDLRFDSQVVTRERFPVPSSRLPGGAEK